jgi:hypothetical protein
VRHVKFAGRERDAAEPGSRFETSERGSGRDVFHVSFSYGRRLFMSLFMRRLNV